MSRTEIITRIEGPPTGELAPGVELRVLATGSMGARGLTTCLAKLRPAAELPYHRHPCSEVMIVVEGEALACVRSRRYHLRQYDALHVPAGFAHSVRNASGEKPALLHSSFAADNPAREQVKETFTVSDLASSPRNGPEHLVRFDTAKVYELAPQAMFRDLFNRRLGSRGVCGGYGIFAPGTSLPCHYHEYDESITIVTGSAICQVAGREYELSGCDTGCIPKHRPHRFLNRSSAPMAMIWVYGGDEPERTLLEPGYSDGTKPFTAVWR
jgi:mannose-6-phosphate isomerase-like protein (cupin superfamily)